MACRPIWTLDEIAHDLVARFVQRDLQFLRLAHRVVELVRRKALAVGQGRVGVNDILNLVPCALDLLVPRLTALVSGVVGFVTLWQTEGAQNLVGRTIGDDVDRLLDVQRLGFDG